MRNLAGKLALGVCDGEGEYPLIEFNETWIAIINYPNVTSDVISSNFI